MIPQELRSCRHVLFDFDGTLVDSREAIAECYRHVFRVYLSQDFPPPGRTLGEIYAMRPAEVFTLVAPSRANELTAAYQDSYAGASKGFVRLFEGADRMLTALKKSGRIPSLVTTKELARVQLDLQRVGIDINDFAAIVTAEDTAERKPHPAPIRMGLQRAGADSTSAIYVGDGPQDVYAARSAGLLAVAVTYGFYTRQELDESAPDAWADSIADLAMLLGVTEP